ncbi:hypothetical protein AALP_AA2G252100 [Arabis alpina]|uniref:Uncharacterized protein n=1 Tax=Arabis alpina TaxID=50452 RepID=A0A087HJV0_ARAAL|nr:hypothetical protein AALP_AA2G252100 [Arabis alpina]
MDKCGEFQFVMDRRGQLEFQSCDPDQSPIQFRFLMDYRGRSQPVVTNRIMPTPLLGKKSQGLICSSLVMLLISELPSSLLTHSLRDYQKAHPLPKSPQIHSQTRATTPETQRISTILNP